MIEVKMTVLSILEFSRMNKKLQLFAILEKRGPLPPAPTRWMGSGMIFMIIEMCTQKWGSFCEHRNDLHLILFNNHESV